MKHYYLTLFLWLLLSVFAAGQGGISATTPNALLPDYKVNVRGASTANLTTVTALNNGLSVDGLTVGTGERWLLKDQSSAATNGIYTAGRKQVETATVSGAVTGTGNATVVVTSGVVAGSPLTVSVAVVNGDSAATVAGKIRTALNGTAAVTDDFTISGASTAVVLTAILSPGNDGTVNVSIANGTCTGLTAAATSANTTAGLATLRATDSATWTNLQGAQVVVSAGTANKGTLWINNSAETGTVGSTALTYTQAGATTTLTSTQVGYGSGTNLVTGEAAFSYNASTNTLDVDKVTVDAVVYGAGWSGNLGAAAMDAVYDKIESLAGGGFDSTTVDNPTWSDGGNASNLWTFDVAGGTDTTWTFGDNNWIWETGSVDLGAAGVRFSHDGDGALTLMGLGNGSDEALTLNFDDTADAVTVSSSTGVTAVNFGSIGLTGGIVTSALSAANTRNLYLTGQSLTGADQSPAIEYTGEWNTTGAPVLLKMNVTDTASDGTAAFLDFQIAGASKFLVTKEGNLTTVGNLTLSGGVRIEDDNDGAVTFTGLGNGSDEDFTLNLDDTANTIVMSSSTGVTTLSLPSIGLSTILLTATNANVTNNIEVGNNGTIRTGTSAGSWSMQAYDVDNTTYRSFVLLTAGNTPTMDISAPSGGTLTGTFTTLNSTAAAATTFRVLDNVNQSHGLSFVVASDLTADRNLTITTGDAARSITLSGNPTLNDWFDQSVKAAATPVFAGANLSTGTATLGTVAGAVDAGGATSLEIPNGADPDLTVEGQISYETDVDVIRAFDGTVQVAVARKIQQIDATVMKPNDLADAQRDACYVWVNKSGMSFVVTGWDAMSDTDDTDLNIEEVDNDGANNATVDAVTIATNGTGIFTGADTTITAATIENGHRLVLDFDDTDAPGIVQITIYGYYLPN